MVKKSNNARKDGPRAQGNARATSIQLLKVLRELLESGFIALPKISRQWQNRIMTAIEGETLPLESAFWKFHEQLDPLLEMQSQHPITERWRQSEFQYLYRVAQVLMFWLTLCKDVESELKHAK